MATWAEGGDPLKAVAESGQRISKAAMAILDALCGEAEDEPRP